MAVFVVVGELGAGKSLQAVAKIRDALMRGCRVATNMDIRIERLVPMRRRSNRGTLHRLSDWPTLADLQALGKAYEGPFDEARFGWIVLDELATFMNSRDWQGPERLKLLNWLRHARKLRWHLLLLSQDIESLDKQVRAALCEHVVRCRRLDRFSVPFLSTVSKVLGFGVLHPPRVHLGIVRYGSSPNAPVVDKWWLPDAKALQGAYETEQRLLGPDDPGAGAAATMLDENTAPYLWEPRGAHEVLWKLFGRWGYPESAARSRYDDARVAQLGAAPSCKPHLSYEAWCIAQAAHAGALGAEGGEAPEPARAEPLQEAA